VLPQLGEQRRRRITIRFNDQIATINLDRQPGGAAGIEKVCGANRTTRVFAGGGVNSGRFLPTSPT